MHRPIPLPTQALLALLLVSTALAAQDEPPSPAVEQLRHAAGRWEATTEFLEADGSVAASFEGTYELDW